MQYLFIIQMHNTVYFSCLPLLHTNRQASEANFSIHSQLHLAKKINLIHRFNLNVVLILILYRIVSLKHKIVCFLSCA